MTREFKFRFWDEEMKDYWDWEEIQNDWESDGYFDTAFRQDHWTCEQFTGHLDDNGKEIYEGDICRVSGEFYDAGIDEVIVCDFTDTVVSLEQFFAEATLRGVYAALGHGTLKVEVIGNIHENKELLND